MTDDRIVEASRRLAAALRPGDLDQTLANITAAAVEVLPDVQSSSLTVRHADGRLETVAPTNDALREVDAAQYELQEGPCYEAAVDTVHVVAPHLAADGRFPRYAPVALGAGIRAQAGIRLFDAPHSNGALNLYSDKVGAFEDLGVLSELFAHQSAVALEFARRIDQLEEAGCCDRGGRAPWGRSLTVWSPGQPWSHHVPVRARLRKRAPSGTR